MILGQGSGVGLFIGKILAFILPGGFMSAY